MIGIFDYTVILTYGGLICALLGMVQAFKGNYIAVMLLLGGALLCDTLDGKVARSKKNRTDMEKMNGIQLDTLCDQVSFGVFPPLVFYTMGLRNWAGILAILFYCFCTTTRLSYYNVLAINKKPDEKSVFHGFPCPCLSILLPVVLLIGLWVPETVMLWIMGVVLVAMGCLYIWDIEIKKPSWTMLIILCLVYWVPFGVYCFIR